MEEKKIVRRDKKDITDNKIKQKKILFGVGLAIFAVLYVFLLTLDMDKKSDIETEEIKNSPVQEEVKSENVAGSKPVDGGTINLSVSRFSTVNPIENKEKSLDSILRLVYDSLFEYDPNYNLQNELASDYSFNENASELTININSNAKWHDGSKVTGFDVEYTVNLIKKNPQSSYSSLVSNIESMTARSGSIILKLKNSNSLEIYNMIFPLISSKSENNKSAVFNDGSFGVIGNGMYKVIEYKQGKQFTLQRNPLYYGAKPHIENIEVSIFDSKDIRQNMFIASNIDMIDSDYYQLSKYQYDIFKVQKFENRKFEMIIFNSANAPFDQRANRIEIAKIIDLEKTVQDAYRGTLNINLMPVNTKSDLNLATENIYSLKTDELKYESKLKLQDKIVILTDKDDPMKHRLAYIIKNTIETSGISPDVQVRAVAKTELGEIVAAKNFNILVAEYNVPVDKNVTRIINTYSSVFAGYNPKEINTMMMQVKATPSKEAQKTKYKKIQEDIIKNIPYIGVGYKNDYMIINKRLSGELEPTEFEIYNGIENIYIPS
ncbi:ABC transporter substrate-binding protein [Proteocatella sphenisci]|uniref:ABC transporter substrate-binding protein n=1 Tax=Proteocatella sphenisci TaxID=181070 RepID=UPI000490645A|nr:ABC transporter substrate-binding protein [Proteocatella sphenisci]